MEDIQVPSEECGRIDDGNLQEVQNQPPAQERPFRRVFKPFKPPAFISPARKELVEVFKRKLQAAVDNITYNSENDEEVNLTTSPVGSPMEVIKKEFTDADFKKPLSSVIFRSKSQQSTMLASVAKKPKLSPEIPLLESQKFMADDGKKYYAVVWAKITTKKHRTWTDDGLLIVNGTQGTLKTNDGKVVFSAKLNLPDEVVSGETEFKYGGKVIQIQDILTAADVVKLRDPEPENLLVQLPLTKLPDRLISKPFISPGGNFVFTGNKEKGKPMFDPDGPNALVMPVPDRVHQHIYNPEKDDIVPVVVDPHISRHLRAHQRDGVIFMYKALHTITSASSSTGVILADEMGLGKTLQTVALLWTMMKQNPYNNGKKEVKKALIVTPSSLVKNWEKEFNRWLGAERIRIFGVDSDHPLKECPSMYPVVIISYDMCTRSEEMLKRMKFDLMICDEAHKLKNKNGQAYQLLIGLSCNRRVLLTGTPIQNDLSELYSLVNFGIPGVLGSEHEFAKEYEQPISRILDSNSSVLDKHVGEVKARALNTILSEFFLRRDHSVMTKYLPPRLTYVIFCRPTETQVNVYRRLLQNTKMDSSATLSSILAMKKLCNHPLLVHPIKNNNGDLYKGLGELQIHDKFYAIEESGKLHVLVRILQSLKMSGEKVVVVSHYTQTLDVLEEAFKTHSFAFVRLDGSTQSKQRQGIVDKFNSDYGDSFIFLLSSKAGGLGLNLQGASRIILYDIDWNPAHDMQAMARCWRPGQKKTTHIYRLITTGTIEERIYLRQIQKQDLSGSVMDLIINNPTNFSPEELKDIFSFCESEKCLTHDLMECGCKKDGTNKKYFENSQRNRTEELTKYKKKTNIPIGELQKWEHFGSQFDYAKLDPVFYKLGLDITFIFRNKSDESQCAEQLPVSP